MAKNVHLKSRRDTSVQGLVKSSPGTPKPRAERSPKDLRKESKENDARMERLRLILAEADSPVSANSASAQLRRRPHHRRELERRRSAALFMQVIMLGVVLLAVAGWMNQKLHFLGR